MDITYSVLEVTKAGNQPSEREDAAWPDLGLTGAFSDFSCAIADGATQGSHSGPWALALCKAFTMANKGEAWNDTTRAIIESAHRDFLNWEKAYVRNRADLGRQLQWFEEAVMGGGAFSTILGIDLETAGDGSGLSYKAMAIGDSCLFHVREDKIITSFPLETSAQFGHTPFLLSTQTSQNLGMLDALRTVEGPCIPGDSFFLCTDALAAWILREKELAKDPTPILLDLALGGLEPFATFIRDLRESRRMRNDDVTFVHLSLKV